MPASSSTPASGCRRISAHSSSFSFAGLFSTSGRDDELADVMEQRANAEPEERSLVETRSCRECAREVGNSLAVTLGVAVLCFDRLAPSPDDVDELALEVRRLSIHVREIAASAKLREELVRAVERLQRLAITPLPAMHFGLLTRCLGQQQQVLSR